MESGEWLPGRWAYPPNEPLSLTTRGRGNLLGLNAHDAIGFRGVEDLDLWENYFGTAIPVPPLVPEFSSYYTQDGTGNSLPNSWGNLARCGCFTDNRCASDEHIGIPNYAFHEEIIARPNFVTSTRYNYFRDMLVDATSRATLSSNFVYDFKVSINNTLGWYPWTRPDYHRNITISDINDIRAALWRRGNSLYLMFYYRYVHWGAGQTYMGMDYRNESGEPEWVWDSEYADYSQAIEEFNTAYNKFPASRFYQSQKPVFRLRPYDSWSGCDPECFGDCEFCDESPDYRIHPGDILPGMPDAIEITDDPVMDREYSRVYMSANKAACQDDCQDHRHGRAWLCSLLDANPKTAFWFEGTTTGQFLSLWTTIMEWETYGLGEPRPSKDIQFVTQCLSLEQKARK